MKNLTTYIALLTLVALFSASSCKKCHDPANPDCENYDPCYGKTPTSASFKIYERFGNIQQPTGWIEYATDTIASSSAFFVADDSTAAKYTWYVGIDTFHTRSFRLNNFPANATIPIKLVTEKAPNTECFPNDNGKDSIVKNMRVIPGTMTLLKGQWFGYNEDSPQDTFTINVSFNINSFCFIYNLLPGFDCPFPANVGYRQLISTNSFFSTTCNYAYGLMLLDSINNDVMRLDYYYYTDINEINSKVHKVFIGTRNN